MNVAKRLADIERIVAIDVAHRNRTRIIKRAMRYGDYTRALMYPAGMFIRWLDCDVPKTDNPRYFVPRQPELCGGFYPAIPARIGSPVAVKTRVSTILI